MRKESGQPDHPLLPLCRVHRLRHPLGDGWFKERKGDVRDHKGSGAAGNVWVYQETPHWCGLRLVLALLGLLCLHGTHDEEEQQTVDQADEGQDDERHRLAGELIEKASERWSHQTSEGDKCQGNTKSFGSLILFSVSRTSFST